MKLGLGIREPTEERLRYVKQLGCDGVTCFAQAMPSYAERGAATVDDVASLQASIQAYDLELLVIRLDPKATYATLFGKPERDREIENICATLRAAGQVGVPTVFFNLTPWRSLDTAWPDTEGIPRGTEDDLRPGSGPGRYYRHEGRGGAVLLTHSSDRAEEDARHSPPESTAPEGEISAEKMWEHLTYLYERIIPVAEEAGVNVGAHPDDPPERVYRGVEQVLNSVEGLKRLVELVPSSRNGLLFCIGTVHEMGADAMAAITHFLEHGKIFSAHFRNPSGSLPAGRYCEDFLDMGDLDMLEVMRLFHEHDYQGVLDPDHAIGIVEDERGRVGFAWELGYMKALMQRLGCKRQERAEEPSTLMEKRKRF